MAGTDALHGALEVAASTQASTDDPWRDAEPGKMLHELEERLLGPVDVLEDEDQGLGGGELGRPLARRPGDLLLAALALVVGLEAHEHEAVRDAARPAEPEQRGGEPPGRGAPHARPPPVGRGTAWPRPTPMPPSST